MANSEKAGGKLKNPQLHKSKSTVKYKTRTTWTITKKNVKIVNYLMNYF